MRKRALGILILLFTLSVIFPTNSAADIKGTPCSKKGEKRIDNGNTYVCAPDRDNKLGWGLSLSESPIIVALTPCSKKGDRRIENGNTYVCTPGQDKKLFWKLSFESFVANCKSNNPKIRLEQANPKPIPTLIPNTNIPWPLPNGDLCAYEGVKEEQRSNNQLGLAGLHNEGITGKGYSIAFIDSHIARSHPAFSSIDVICINADDFSGIKTVCPKITKFSHGQGVAGTMGGKFGVAPGARLISIEGTITGGLTWVFENYKKYAITAVSLSVGAVVSDRENVVCGVAVPYGLKEILTKLSNEDVAVLFSTANQSTVNWVREPNCMPGVISVASVKATNPTSIQPYSSISPDIDLLAPADFYSTGTNGKVEKFGGTSQATPFAAALFALGKQARPDANIAQIFYYIKKTAAPVDDVIVKQIPVIRPVEMVKALKEAKELPAITLVKQIQVKSGE